MGWKNILQPIFGYLTSSTLEESVVVAATVESVALTADESTFTAVESVCSVVVDPLPHAVNAIMAKSAKTNVYFFISVNIRKNIDYTKLVIKNPNDLSGF
jgi:hypothetical protein